MLVVGSAAGRKNRDTEPSLPPLTAEGKNTFGCRVNGSVFLPRSKCFNSPVTCAYQKLYSGDAGFVFVVAGDYSDPSKCQASTIRIYLDSISLQEGTTYQLSSRAQGQHEGLYFTTSDCGTSARNYVTNNELKGELTISRFDPIRGIAAGTFWFDALGEAGDTVRITDGRFDMEYTD